MSRQRMRVFCVMAMLGPAALLISSAMLRADEQEDDDGPGFAVRIVDEQGHPVKGARVATWFYFDVGDSTWKSEGEVASGAEGIARFGKGSANLDYFCVSAIDATGKHTGIANLKPAGPWNPAPTIVLRPACKVHGNLISSDLAKSQKPLGLTDISLNLEDKRVQGSGEENGGRFELLLPPGQFDLESHSSNTHSVGTLLVIEPGREVLDLGDIDLPATRVALLQGEPAPALAGIVAWKNSQGVKLTDLHGKWVLLDFWGYWCGPCVGSMPDLMKFYDQHKVHGLEVVGVHVDVPEDAGLGVVDSVDKLDEKLAEVRKELWKGRDLPFPVALVRAQQVPYGPRIAKNARCQACADYGVTSYPTHILIDPQGRIVGKVQPRHAEGRAKIEELMGLSVTKPE